MASEPTGPRRFPDEAGRASILVASAGTCCVCNIPRLSVQLHHIDGDRTNADPDNFAVLCLICHDDTQVRGGFGRRLTAEVVRIYRDNWLRIVAERREELVRDLGRRAAAGHAVVGGSLERTTDDVVDRLLEEAERSPREAIRHTQVVLERDLRGLLASSGWGNNRWDWQAAEAIDRLFEVGVISASVHGSFKVFGDTYRAVAAGEPTGEEDVLRGLDVGLFTIRAVAAIPRERHYVLHADLETYRDAECLEPVPDVRVILVRSVGPAPRRPHDHAFLTTGAGLAAGTELTWTWGPANLGSAWYRDPTTGVIGQASSMDFQGRRLDDIA